MAEEAENLKIDRTIQKAVLDRLADAYPNPVHTDGLSDLFDDTRMLTACCAYLHEHGLIRAKITDFMSEGRELLYAEISAKGIDFLADDGGLSAILGPVTIKFHEDSLRQMIELRLAKASDQQVAPEEKTQLVQALRGLPADSIKHLTTRLLDLGMDNLPRAVEIVRTFLS